jgi:hypothetical protein
MTDDPLTVQASVDRAALLNLLGKNSNVSEPNPQGYSMLYIIWTKNKHKNASWIT